MSVQNPTIPTPTQAKGIDAVVLDLQTMLDTSLTWLTNGAGRAYRLSKIEVNKGSFFLPEVRLNDGRFGYVSVTPDNDKTGQSFFYVGDASLEDYQEYFFNLMSYPVSVIFTANLKTIDAALLATEDFTEHLIEDVNTAFRQPRGKNYKVFIDSIQREFEDVYAEFDITNDRGVAHNPLTHFRFNLTIQFREDCPPTSLNRCAAILQNISQDELLNCILPTYDFSSTTTQDALTETQVSDLTTWLCGVPNPPSSMVFDGVNENVFGLDRAVYDFDGNSPFSFAIWLNSNAFSGTRAVFGKRINLGAGYGCIFSNNTMFVALINTNNTNQISKGFTLAVSASTWYRVLITYDGSKTAAGVNLYLNGVAQSGTVFIDNLTGDINSGAMITIGRNSQTGSQWWAGKQADVSIWNTELTAANAITDYHGGDLLDEPILPVNNVFSWQGGKGALYGGDGNWVFPELSGNNDDGLPYSALMEFADRDLLDYPGA